MNGILGGLLLAIAVAILAWARWLDQRPGRRWLEAWPLGELIGVLATSFIAFSVAATVAAGMDIAERGIDPATAVGVMVQVAGIGALVYLVRHIRHPAAPGAVPGAEVAPRTRRRAA
jgi:Mg/Co/Ni transporter MgtE